MGDFQAPAWGAKEPVAIPDVDILASGFSCKDASALSTTGRSGFQEDDLERIFNLDIEYEETKRESTIPTLRGVLGYIRVHLPLIVFLENIKNLLAKVYARGTKSFFDHVTNFLGGLGYDGAARHSQSNQWSVPMSRARAYGMYLHTPQLVRKSLSVGPQPSLPVVELAILHRQPNRASSTMDQSIMALVIYDCFLFLARRQRRLRVSILSMRWSASTISSPSTSTAWSLSSPRLWTRTVSPTTWSRRVRRAPKSGRQLTVRLGASKRTRPRG